MSGADLPIKLRHLPQLGALPVPWIASWDSEDGETWIERFDIGGRERWIVRHPERIGVGTPRLGQTSFERQRQAVARGLCQVCAQPMTRRYVALSTGTQVVRIPSTGREVPLLTEPPCCATCASVAMMICPGVRGRQFVEVLRSETVACFVRPLGDPVLDRAFLPLTPDDVPPEGAIGYVKLAIVDYRPADIRPWG